MTRSTRWTVGALPTPAASKPLAVPPEIAYPARGTGRFTVAAEAGPVVGPRGRLLRYRIAVEGGITGITATGFARAVSRILDDPRGWTGTGRWRLQLVPTGARYDFTIYLAAPATREVLCQSAYDRYTSCRRDDKVVLNVARWVHGVPDHGADLAAYRAYIAAPSNYPLGLIEKFVSGWRPQAVPGAEPFTFAAVPRGFPVDNIDATHVTFGPPGTAPSPDGRGQILVRLDPGPLAGAGQPVTVAGRPGLLTVADGTVLIRLDAGADRILSVEVPATIHIAREDLLRFAAGIRPTGAQPPR